MCAHAITAAEWKWLRNDYKTEGGICSAWLVREGLNSDQLFDFSFDGHIDYKVGI